MRRDKAHNQGRKHQGGRSDRDRSGAPQPISYTVLSDSGPQIRPELIDSEALSEAKKCERVNKTQLRRFFGEAISERNRVKTDNQAKVVMVTLKAKAHYASARDKNNAPLVDFFLRHAASVSTKVDFEHFMQHFEAVIAYHRYLSERKGTRR